MSGTSSSLLSEQSALAQVIQDQRIKRHTRAREQVRPAATRYVILQAKAVSIEVGLVLLEQRLGDAHLGHVVVLDVAELQIALEIRLDLLGAECLDGEEVVFPA